MQKVLKEFDRAPSGLTLPDIQIAKRFEGESVARRGMEDRQGPLFPSHWTNHVGRLVRKHRDASGRSVSATAIIRNCLPKERVAGVGARDDKKRRFKRRGRGHHPHNRQCRLVGSTIGP
jgi:hypothetical protein